jgi:hypothetical protein
MRRHDVKGKNTLISRSGIVRMEIYFFTELAGSCESIGSLLELFAFLRPQTAT